MVISSDLPPGLLNGFLITETGKNYITGAVVDVLTLNHHPSSVGHSIPCNSLNDSCGNF